MSDFSDAEDYLLFQLVKAKIDAGEAKINWDQITQKMKHTKKSRHAIRIRFKTLKRTHGPILDLFPSRFFRPLRDTTCKKQKRMKQKMKKLDLIQFRDTAVWDVSASLMLLSSSRKSRLKARPSDQVHDILKKLFSAVKQSDIHQMSGKGHLNCGEVTYEGVTCILEALGDVNSTDSFADIGSGIGNVVAQVALEVPVQMCFGIDCQKKVVQLAKQIIKGAISLYPELSKISLADEDIRAPKWHIEVNLRACTILYCNNLLFESDANLQLEEFTTCPNHVRYVILLKKFCHRHRPGCHRKFCVLWNLFKVVQVPVHWSSTLVDVYVFRKK